MDTSNQTPPLPETPKMPGFAVLLSLVMLVAGVYLAATKQEWSLLAAGSVAIVVTLCAWEIAREVVASKAARAKAMESAAALGERVEQIAVLLNVISEQQLLSDRAKSVAFREKDSEALRRAIREEIAKQNYEGAIVLVDDMERTFGYKAEAETFRGEIAQHREESTRKLVAEAMSGIDRMVRDERWADAFKEADKLKDRFPTLKSVELMPREIEMRREAHKKQLLAEWNSAVNRHEPDVAIATLKRLDPYLTPAEAEAMQETVRGVFKEKLNGLRTQLSLAVQDHHWQQAIRLGEEIMRDFPNTRIAAEVKEMMEALKQHAVEEPEEEPVRT